MANKAPDWKRLGELGGIVEHLSKKKTLTHSKWKSLMNEALAASNDHPQFTELVANFEPE